MEEAEIPSETLARLLKQELADRFVPDYDQIDDNILSLGDVEGHGVFYMEKLDIDALKWNGITQDDVVFFKDKCEQLPPDDWLKCLPRYDAFVRINPETGEPELRKERLSRYLPFKVAARSPRKQLQIGTREYFIEACVMTQLSGAVRLGYAPRTRAGKMTADVLYNLSCQFLPESYVVQPRQIQNNISDMEGHMRFGLTHTVYHKLLSRDGYGWLMDDGVRFSGIYNQTDHSDIHEFNFRKLRGRVLERLGLAA